jgi:hypothetical protein
MSDFEEKLTVKILLNGKVIGEFDMGKPSKSTHITEDIIWYASGHVQATEKFFPYQASLHLSRPDNKIVNESMRKLCEDLRVRAE